MTDDRQKILYEWTNIVNYIKHYNAFVIKDWEQNLKHGVGISGPIVMNQKKVMG